MDHRVSDDDSSSSEDDDDADVPVEGANGINTQAGGRANANATSSMSGNFITNTVRFDNITMYHTMHHGGTTRRQRGPRACGQSGRFSNFPFGN